MQFMFSSLSDNFSKVLWSSTFKPIGTFSINWLLDLNSHSLIKSDYDILQILTTFFSYLFSFNMYFYSKYFVYACVFGHKMQVLVIIICLLMTAGLSTCAQLLWNRCPKNTLLCVHIFPCGKLVFYLHQIECN